MFLIDVIKATPLANRRLALEFADGLKGIVSVDALVGEYTGVFAPLLNPDFFAQVHVDAELGTVVWPSGADLCPDVLYAHAAGQAGRLAAPAT